MSPNAPVPPPPPPPGGAPGNAPARGDETRVAAYVPPAGGWQPPAAPPTSPPPAFAPASGQAVRSPAPRYTPADGQATVVQPAVGHGAAPQQPTQRLGATPPAQHTAVHGGDATFVQRVTPTTDLPTAAQPAVPAPSPAPVPPQRVRYATEQGYGGAPTVRGVGAPAAYAPAAAQSSPQAPTTAYAPAAAPQAGYHPPAQPGGYAPQPAPAPAAAPATRAPATRAGAGGGRGGSGPRKTSGRLSPGWIAFIVVDVLLVIGAVVFAISLAGGGSDDDPKSPVTSGASPSAETTEDAGTAPQEPTVSESFASKTKNISCEMTDVGVTCSIAELASQPAPVAGCEGTVGYRVVLDAEGVTQPCVPAAEQPRAAGGDVEVLPYGESKTVGGFTCDSADTGVTCRDDATGKGFTVARAGIRSL